MSGKNLEEGRPSTGSASTLPVTSFTWQAVSYSVTVKKGKETTEKKLLNNMSGEVFAGQVVGIMGGSGAGKSTFLNTLAGRIGPGKLSGDILVDGQPRNPSTWNRQCAYVEQDDIMFRNLSVYETFRYSALLRLPGAMSYKEKMDRVESVIAALGLQGCRDTWIGDTQTRGISGGERKRVSIGIELVTNPQILFLDEVPHV
jgi:ABC-type multidrug transport system ATPase subunit